MAILLSGTKDNPTLGQHAKFLQEEAQTAIVQAGIWLAIETDPAKGQNRLRGAIDGLWQATQGPVKEEEQKGIMRAVLAGRTNDFKPVATVFEHVVNKLAIRVTAVSLPKALSEITQNSWGEAKFRLQTVFPFLEDTDFAKIENTLRKDHYLYSTIL